MIKEFKNLENWFKELKKEYNKLSDSQIRILPLIENLTSVNSVETIWIENQQYGNIQFHFFKVETPNNEDIDVSIELIDSSEVANKLGRIIRDKWDYPLSEADKSMRYNVEKYSDAIEIIFLNGLKENLYTSKSQGDSPIIINKSFIAFDLFCWVNIGKIQDLKVSDVIESIISKNEGNSPKVEINSMSYENVVDIPFIKPKLIKGYGTYFYPPIWIGDYPKLSFEDKLSETSLLSFLNKAVDLEYKNRVLIIDNDGFIGIQETNKHKALQLLNEIMAVALFLEIPAMQINESELADIEIDEVDLTIRSRRMTINSMRTILADNNSKMPSSTIEYEREKIDASNLVELCQTAENFTADKVNRDFLLFYLESKSMLENYSFSQSFIMSWVIIESYLALLWEENVVKKIDKKDRKKKLLDTVRWSADYIIEALNLLNIIIDDDCYSKLMRLKKKRNKIVHEGKVLTKIESEECLELAFQILKKRLKLDKTPVSIFESLKTTLKNNNVNFNKIIADFGQVEASQKRDAGHEFTFNEHLKALIYSMLSNHRRWVDIVDKLPQIDKIFFNFDHNKLENCDTKNLLSQIIEIKAGNISINRQMEALPHNIKQLKKIQKDFGSLDNFVTSDSPSEVVKLLSNEDSPYKIKQIRDALSLEYLKSVGVRGMKPDVHIIRICGPERLDFIRSKDTTKQLEEFKNFAEEVGVSETYLDNLIWIFGADGFGEICTETPHCDKCQLIEYCNYKN